jgi:DNA-binding CsgD family transcriptional regulator
MILQHLHRTKRARRSGWAQCPKRVAGSTGQRNTYQGWSVDMKQRRRIYYSAAKRSEIWNRWQAGEPVSAIGRRFDRESSSVFSVISPTGGIRPPDRRRSKQTLSLSEREEISRWLSMRCSLRLIATHLGRSASIISREVHRNGGSNCTEISASPEIMIAVAAERTRHIKLGTETILSGLGQPSADLQARRSSLASRSANGSSVSDARNRS